LAKGRGFLAGVNILEALQEIATMKILDVFKGIGLDSRKLQRYKRSQLQPASR
jgi:hypothetical protein